ncbi:MAG: FIST C-terminal domain-containing protein [Polyangiaceae bacterium]|nr:FIST C-terminal domain-containing protein [Polyangiaceae bacterium]
MLTQVACLRTGRATPASLEELSSLLGGASPVFVAAFASPAAGLEETLGALADRFPTATIVGSTTSGECTQAGDGSHGVALFALAGDFKVHAGIAEGLRESPERAVAEALEGQPVNVAGYPKRTAIVLLDPMAGRGEEAALILATNLGEVPLVGGAAGDDLAMVSTSVGLGGRAASNAIVVASLYSKAPLGVGVCHGHQPLSKPLTATRVDGSVVLEIDGRPAWDVWREVTRERGRELGLDPEANPGAYLLRFEAGLRVGHEYKVRAPLAPKPGGGILFATALMEGTVFTVMESDPTAQVDSAVAAATAAREALQGAPIAGALVFDCICRKLILGDRYAEALAKLSVELGGVPLAGFETYGEIAMNSGDMSGFHNTTTVVLAFPRSWSPIQ